MGPDFAFEFFDGRHEAVARDLIHQLPPPPLCWTGEHLADLVRQGKPAAAER